MYKGKNGESGGSSGKDDMHPEESPIPTKKLQFNHDEEDDHAKDHCAHDVTTEGGGPQVKSMYE